MNAGQVLGLLFLANLLLYFFIPSAMIILLSVMCWVPILAHVRINWTVRRPRAKQDFSELTQQGLLRTTCHSVQQVWCFSVTGVAATEFMPVPKQQLAGRGADFYFFQTQDEQIVYVSHTTLKQLRLLNDAHFPSEQMTIYSHQQTGEILDIVLQGKTLSLNWQDCVPSTANFQQILMLSAVLHPGQASSDCDLARLNHLFTEADYLEEPEIPEIPRQAILPQAPSSVSIPVQTHLQETYYPRRVLHFPHPKTAAACWIVELAPRLLLYLTGAYLAQAQPHLAHRIQLSRQRQTREIVNIEQQHTPVVTLHIAQARSEILSKINFSDGQFSAQHTLDDIYAWLSGAK